MTSPFINNRPASTGFRPNGVYLGTVKRVDAVHGTLWVEIERLSRGHEFGPLLSCLDTTPSVGDRVVCSFLEGRTDDLIVIGSIGLFSVTEGCVVSDTEPSPSSTGLLWFDTSLARMFVTVFDGVENVWVEVP